MAKPKTYVDPAGVHVIAPNFKQRLSGVTSTIIQLVPVQNRLGQKVAVLGPGLPPDLPHLRFRDLWKLWRPPEGRKNRVWHARRNIEMLPGIILRDILRMPLKLVFTSASQRKHSAWTRFLIRQMDAVIATSAKTSAYLEVPNTVVMHGIDCDKFRPAENKADAKRACGLAPDLRYIGCFGRIRHQKGTDLFVDAMIELLPSHSDWAAIIAGRATPKHIAFEEELKAKVNAAGLGERILFVGEHKNIADWYRTLDLFVAPQRWEGFGLTPLEAMATGVPVVATDVGAFAELVRDGETGSVIAVDDVTTMAAATENWLDDNNCRHLGAANTIATVRERFRIEDEAAALGRVYGQRSILIVGKNSSYGLTKDGLLIEKALRDAGFSGTIKYGEYKNRGVFPRLLIRKSADIAIHVERIYPQWRTAATQTFVVPNQERFPLRHVSRLARVAGVLAKSRHAEQVFASKGAKVHFVGFTSEDRADPSIRPDYGKYLHVAGGSTLKGTEDVLAAWHQHPEWPELILVVAKHLAPQNAPPNVRLLTEYLADEELKQLQNSCGIHLCPSRSEGWGHYIVEAMSCSAVVITTDGVPMNELVQEPHGLLVPATRTERRHLGTNFFVDTQALAETIERTLTMSPTEKEAMGNAARAYYEQISSAFRLRLAGWLDEVIG